MHYRDLRTAGIRDYCNTLMPKSELYNETGIQFMDFNTVFQLLAEKKDNPGLLEQADGMLFTPDLLGYFLTGARLTEYTIASTGQLLDAKARDWSEKIIGKLGLPRKIFGDIVKPGTVAGKLLPEITDEIGSLDAKVVKVASHDTASAVVAVPASTDKFIFISSGTWSIMGTETAEPVISDKTYEYDFTNEGGYGGTIRLCKNITGLWIEQEARRQWKREGESLSFNDLTEMAKQAKPLRSLINPNDALFSPPGDMPRRIAEYCRKTGQPVPETKGEIVRCIFDSLALSYRRVAEMLDSLTGERIPAINIVGGGTKEEMLSELAASACGRTVYTGPVEATAMGNIAAQAMAAGEIGSLSEAREIVANSCEMGVYQPVSGLDWDTAYERFLKLPQ
ncbi:MAG: rhamnulokinase [Clostridia bacterium]|nr:rhamnulokinase [Clostridia bacterium]